MITPRTAYALTTAALLGCAFAPAGAAVELRETVQELPFSIEPDAQPHPLTFSQFDEQEGLRGLVGVILEVEALLRAEATAENDSDQETDEFDLVMIGTVTTNLSNLSSPSCSFEQTFSCPDPPIGPSDGVPGSGPDFCAYGTVSTTLTFCDVPEGIQPPPSTAPYIGNGSIDAEVTAFGGFTVLSPFNVTFTFDDFRAEGNVRVTYQFLIEVGACRLADGTCDLLDEVECGAQGGAYQGVDTECATTDCLGACCVPSGACLDTTLDDCTSQAGTYNGFATTCATTDCLGACCRLDGSCTVVTVDDCTGLGGTYVGFGATCETAGCPAYACCLPDGTCTDGTVSECAFQGGFTQGLGTTCATVSCDGACCLINETCVFTDLVDCTGQGGFYQGYANQCTNVTCGTVIVPRGCGEKGSLVYFSKIEVRWDGAGALINDTFVSLLNDYPADVAVQMYFINGDPPLPATVDERAHPGWNHVSAEITLTKNEPAYWSAVSGEPKGVPPWEILDPPVNGLPGRPDPEGGTDRVLRGFIVGWAVNAQNEEIRWNHLAGATTHLDFANQVAWEVRACSFQVITDVANGDQTGQDPGVLNLDGIEYAACPDQLLLDFYAVGAFPFNTGAGADLGAATDLTLHPVSVDLRQEDDGPVTTKARIDVWNENEIKFNGTELCITCWDQRLLANFSSLGIPNNFLVETIQTNKAKARINGVMSQNCNVDVDITDGPLGIHPDDVVSRNAALLGVAAKLVGPNQVSAASGMSLVGLGLETATIRYDLPEQTPESTGPVDGPDGDPHVTRSRPAPNRATPR